MSEGNSLINFGDLSRPATVLIERISDAVGTLFEPHQIQRVAKAEAEANKIKALSDIEVTDIQQRAIARMIHEEGKKQENIESITAQAAQQVNNEAEPEMIEKDWISHFFEKCRSVSDKEMQSLWSRLLAGEANKAGSFSKRTIELISTLDKSDAHIFTSLCSFSIFTGIAYPIVFDHNAEIYVKGGVGFSQLSHLEYIGLIKFNMLQGFVFQKLPKNPTFNYFGTPITFTLPKDNDNELNMGKVMLTQAGRQLAPVCGAQMNEKFLPYLVDYYKGKEIDVDVVLPNK